MSERVTMTCTATIACPMCGEHIDFEIRFPVTLVTDENDNFQRFHSGDPDHDEAPIWGHVMDKHPEWTEASISTLLGDVLGDKDGES